MNATKSAIKRIIAMCLVAIMTLAMAATAFATEAEVQPAAAPQTGALTVKVDETTNTLKNQTISLYKLFDLSVNGDNYGYTVNDKYAETLKTVLNLTGDPVTSQEYYAAISALQGDAVQTFADDFTKALLTAEPPITADETSGKLGEVPSHTFDDLAYGYYLIYQTGTKEFQSSLVSLDGKGDDITLKGEAPSVEKEADKNTVEIGQIVTYTIRGTIPDTTGYADYTYKIHDTLTEGLDFVEDLNGTLPTDKKYNVSVQIDGEAEEVKEAEITADNDRKMTLDLSQWVKNNQTSVGKEFTVTYYAKVNENAIVGNKNSAELEYGNNPDDTTTTTPDEVITPTYPLDIKKTDDADNLLAGATFRLYRTEDAAKNAGDDAIKVSGSAGNYTVAEDQTTGDMDMVTVVGDLGGYNLRLNGLAAGTYWLVETDAPAGYNKLTAPIKVTIEQDGTNELEWTVDKNDTPEDDKIIDVVNSSGTILPETGGMGTVLFTVVAVVMILGVAISFIRSRKIEE